MDVPLRPTLTVDDGEAEETGFNRMIEVDLQVRFARAFRDGVAPILTISGDLDGIERREVFDVITGTHDQASNGAGGGELKGEPLTGKGEAGGGGVERFDIIIDREREKFSIVVSVNDPFGPSFEWGGGNGETGFDLGELRQGPKRGAVRSIGSGGSNFVGSDDSAAVAETVADIRQHVGEFGIGVGSHRHHRRGIVHAVDITLELSLIHI